MNPRQCPMTVSHVAGAGIVYVRCAHALLPNEVICACCMDRDYDHAAHGVCSSRGERVFVAQCPPSEKADAVAGSGEHEHEKSAREHEPAELRDLRPEFGEARGLANRGQQVEQRADESKEQNPSDHGAPPALNRTTTGQYEMTLTKKGRKLLRKLAKEQGR